MAQSCCVLKWYVVGSRLGNDILFLVQLFQVESVGMVAFFNYKGVDHSNDQTRSFDTSV